MTQTAKVKPSSGEEEEGMREGKGTHKQNSTPLFTQDAAKMDLIVIHTNVHSRPADTTRVPPECHRYAINFCDRPKAPAALGNQLVFFLATTVALAATRTGVLQGEEVRHNNLLAVGEGIRGWGVRGR